MVSSTEMSSLRTFSSLTRHCCSSIWKLVERWVLGDWVSQHSSWWDGHLVWQRETTGKLSHVRISACFPSISPTRHWLSRINVCNGYPEGQTHCCVRYALPVLRPTRFTSAGDEIAINHQERFPGSSACIRRRSYLLRQTRPASIKKGCHSWSSGESGV
jgi:hypothetical protein